MYKGLLLAGDVPHPPQPGEPPRDLPAEIIAQLCGHLDELEVISSRRMRTAVELLIDTGRDCEEDFARLLHEGVIVRPMKLYAFPTSQRVTIGTHEENEQFLEALRKITASSVRAAR